MKETAMIYAKEVYVICPYCLERNDGWFGDPSGEETECDICHKHFKIAKESDIEFGY